MVDKKTDKKSRRDAPESWVCRGCQAINALQDDICVECGLPRRRITAAVVLDGHLVEMEVVPGVELPGPTLDEVHAFYCMSLWYARSKGISPGWAYFATQRRFKLDEIASKRLIPYRWRDSEPMTPSAEVSRWFQADNIRRRYAKKHAATHNGAHACR
jgi:hypothetical protein